MNYIVLNKIAEAIVGDEEFKGIAPYRSWKTMKDLFSTLNIAELTQVEIDKENISSRIKYTNYILKRIQQTENFKILIEEIFDDIYFSEVETYNQQQMMQLLNKYLTRENFEIKNINGKYRLITTNTDIINNVEVPFNSDGEITKEFIVKQIQNAQKRIEEQDYLGAITSAKSLLEGIFSYIDQEHNGQSTINNTKDDLIKQYSTIKSILNLDPSQKNLSDALKQILQGLNCIVCGLSFIRNKMSDSHLPQYNPTRHHAILAVNSANTLAQFLFDTFKYQKENSRKSPYQLTQNNQTVC